MVDIEKILAEREEAWSSDLQSMKLVRRYKKKMPQITPKWDTTPESIDFNDINDRILASGLSIYSCTMDALWAGLYDPSIFEPQTMWTERHEPTKIARVINAWENNMQLSPIFLVKHGALDQGLIGDGNHRLTVARYVGANEVPFMVETIKADWVSIAFPSATCIHSAVTRPPKAP